MKQSVVDELIAQRDRVLFGKWVSHSPREPGEACMGFWFTSPTVDYPCSIRCVSPEVTNVLREVLAQRGVSTPCLYDIANWNDRHATRQDVLDVLDEAIRLAKESA